MDLTYVVSGDGKCDFVIADRTTGNLYIVQNNYDAATDKFAWKDPGKWSSVNCNQRYGPGLFDLAVRLADLNGRFILQRCLPNLSLTFDSCSGELTKFQVTEGQTTYVSRLTEVLLDISILQMRTNLLALASLLSVR
jgi:hypothetical protein